MNTVNHIIIIIVIIIITETPLEKCLYDCDTEAGWGIICTGGDPEKGNDIINHTHSIN